MRERQHYDHALAKLYIPHQKFLCHLRLDDQGR